jgi:hypothetical protein|tara:strand:- start:1435 stop:2250 length:816 start_codon:yes stop_codon:yes gene_type:complete
MIYDYIISTGDITLSGCNSSDLGTDTFKKTNVKAGGTAGSFFFDPSLFTGKQEIQLSVNGQNFFQEIPATGQATNEIVFSINTGDFFIKGQEADLLDRSKFFFASANSVGFDSSLKYDITTGGMFVGTGDLGASLATNIKVRYASSVFSEYDYFLNGQKVYSGDGVKDAAGTSFDLTFSVGAGVVTSDNKNEFKYVAYRKKPKTTSLTGLIADITGTGFIEGRTNLYLNGIQEFQNSYLELFTGVNMIKLGFNAEISGGLPLNTRESSLTL